MSTELNELRMGHGVGWVLLAQGSSCSDHDSGQRWVWKPEPSFSQFVTGILNKKGKHIRAAYSLMDSKAQMHFSFCLEPCVVSSGWSYCGHTGSNPIPAFEELTVWGQ